MAKIKRTVGRIVAKAHKRVFGSGKTEVAIGKASGVGLTGAEIKEVLGIISQHKSELPPMTYEYRPPIRFLSKETLYLKPKSGGAGSLAIKVRKILGARFKVYSL